MTHNTHQRGFSLIEILIVIVIITILLSLGVVAMRGVQNATNRSTTAAMLAQLAGVLTEYETQRKQVPGYNGSIQEIDEFIEDVMRLGEGNAAERMLRSIDAEFWNPRYVVDTSISFTLADAWGNQIEYIDDDGTSANLTAANQQPKRLGADSALERRPYFGSAGPDGLWGSFAGGDPTKPDEDARDNIYSFKFNQ